MTREGYSQPDPFETEFSEIGEFEAALSAAKGVSIENWNTVSGMRKGKEVEVLIGDGSDGKYYIVDHLGGSCKFLMDTEDRITAAEAARHLVGEGQPDELGAEFPQV